MPDDGSISSSPECAILNLTKRVDNAQHNNFVISNSHLSQLAWDSFFSRFYCVMFLIPGSEDVLLNPPKAGGFMGWEGAA